MPEATQSPAAPALTNQQRARAVRRLFLRIALHIFFWDIVMTRGPLKRLRRAPAPRWAALARQYRREAERLGGVLIKLGQYVSARVDLLPEEVTHVMADLRDAVPPVPGPQIVAQIEEDFLLPITGLYRSFDEEPIGAASLGQAHRAVLPEGQPVVVKVLRPGIDAIVASDLEIVGQFIRQLKRLESIRRRVDLDLLASEFTAVTYRELDLVAEARNCERFAREFAHDPAIHTPTIYWSRSGRRTLTMEDVSYFPIHDVLGFEAAGIDRRRVASKLMDCYLDQVFRHGFVHADPHPGNLFVRPLAADGESAASWPPFSLASGRVHIPHVANRPFQVVFIDFGMAVEIPERLRHSLTTYATGMVARDAYTIVQSYVEGDLLLPDTDLDELERMTAALINKFPHALVGQVRKKDLTPFAELSEEYQTLLYNSPMKMKAELLFVFRAMGICSGTVAGIDAAFDPAERFMPLAQRLVADELKPDSDRLKRLVSATVRLPMRLDNLLTTLERGKLRIRTDGADRRRDDIRQLTRAANRLGVAVLAGSAMICAVLLGRQGEIVTTPTGLAVLAIAVVAAGVLIKQRS
ncbi:ABC1 kinase family protein [Xanthobacter versatilis]|uniref:ABC1 kinase family protein n=1 Tax=Xanthobacter autotrophicus (strain ATCC BAA-1158 / Py2) TaxID=78245 RepID=UPI003727FEBC